MSDPDERLSSFDPGPSMNPLPPSDVRRQGERLRRRNTALVVGGAVAAVLLVAAPIAVLVDHDAGGKTQPMGPVLDPGVLLTAGEVAPRERLTPWREAEQQGPVLTCAPDSASLDEQSSVRRDFDADIAGGPAGDLPASVVRTEVLGFADDAGARDAYQTVQGWLTECPGGEDAAPPGGTSESTIDLAGGGQGGWRFYSFLAPEYCGDDCDAELFDRMGVARFGDRLVMVSLAEVGGPLEPEGLDGSMDQVFQAAVTKAGGRITGGGSSGSASSEPVGPAIPEEFPLATGWLDPGGDGQITGPDRDQESLQFYICDVIAPDPAYADRMLAVYSAPEDYRTRQLTTYEDADAAVAAVADLVAAYQACPQDGVDEAGYVTHYDVQRLDVGDGSWAILGRDTLDGGDSPFGATTIIVRVGRAVLLLDHGGHAGYPSDDGADVEATLAEAVVPIAEMCAFTRAGCG